MQGLSSKRRAIAVALAAALVLALVLSAATQGLGEPSLPDDAVAVVEDVEDGTISGEDFQSSLAQLAAQEGLNEPPAPGDERYDQLADAAVANLLLAQWVRGEAEDRGIEVTDAEIQEELDTIQQQQFGGREEFERFLRDSPFCTEEELDTEPLECEEANQQVELMLISTKLQEEAAPADPEISDEEVEEFYELNAEQFEVAESRDVRVILNRDEGQVQEAVDLLNEDDSPQSWKRIAERFSTDEATSARGGLREGVVEDQGDPEFDEQVFSAAEGEIVGPFETSSGFYAIQVVGITPAEVTPLEEAHEQIEQSLATARSQELLAEFQDDFFSKWVPRSVCAEDFVMERCANFTGSDTCEGDDPGEENELDPLTGEPKPELECGAFVPSIAPFPPQELAEGTQPGPAPAWEAALPGSQPTPGRPQGPQRPSDPQGAGAVPPGLIPTDPGAVPPQGAPPQGAVPPQGGAPPPGAPPPAP